MDYDTFVGQVQDRAHLDTRGAADTATRATLTTLAERIPPSLAADLSSALPQRAGDDVRAAASAPDRPDTAERMEYGEFLGRVARRAGTGTSKATHEARCVMEVVGAATGDDLVTRIRGSLDDDLAEVLFSGDTGNVF